MERIRSVGIFDSGFGGLTVLAACQKILPAARFYYYGDHGNAPYGGRSPEEIAALVRSALNRFRALNVDAAVLACNTATAVCAERMRREFSFPVVGMEPAVRLAAKQCKNLLVLCTPRTAESDRLFSLCKRVENCRITVHPASGLAGEVERAFFSGEQPRIAEFLPRPKTTTFDFAFDGVVLGCTHYVFFRREISDFYGAPVFDGNEGTAKRLRFLLTDGFDDHHPPRLALAKNVEKNTIFLGEYGQIDEKVHKTNIYSKNFL